jgi:PAS domain S-box-containing protein
MTAEPKKHKGGTTSKDESLKLSEEFYRSVFEQAAEGTVLHDMEGKIILVNPALCESLGYTEQELLKMSVQDVDPYIIIDDHRKKYWETLPLKKTISFESELRRKDGSVISVEVYLRMVQMDKKKRILASVIDITDRKHAQQQHLSHLEFLENLDKINRAIQASTDIDQMMTDVLDTCLSIFDCDRAWLLYPCDPKAPFWSVPMERTKPEFPGAMATGQKITERQEITRVLKAALKSSSPAIFAPGSQYPLPKNLAKRFGCKSQIAMALHPKLHQPWMFGLHQCTYPRQWTAEEERLQQAIGRRLEDALTSLLILRDLQQSEQQYRATFEQAIDSIVLINLETGKIEEFNDNACRNLGYTREEFEKLNLSDIEVIESPEDIIKHIVKMEKQEMDVFETKHKTKTGEIRDILVSSKILTIRGRRLSQGIFRDITERKRAEEKLREYQRKLKSMAVASLLNEERQRRRIAHGLHDDIGQKLAVAKLDLLTALQQGRDHDTTESVKKVCLKIDEMMEKVRSLTFELSNPVLSELGLEAAIERHLSREIRDKHGIEFRLDKCGLLNQLDEDMCICLFRSVRELLNNVVKHSRAQKVVISLDKTDGNVIIVVRDDGDGFDLTEVNSKINAGVGFGLFSIREQLESYAGKLKVESSPGRGSCFTITMPLSVRQNKA